MKVGIWDFSKLPKERHKEVIELVNENQIGKLVAIHDEYSLSSFSAYCCHGNGHFVMRFYKEAIEKEYING